MHISKALAGLAMVAALALSGCATNTIAVADRPRIDSPAPAAMQKCALPVNLPAGEMTQRDVERYWGLDRKNQIACAKRHGILADFINDRDGGLTEK